MSTTKMTVKKTTPKTAKKTTTPTPAAGPIRGPASCSKPNRCPTCKAFRGCAQGTCTDPWHAAKEGAR